MLDCPRCSHIIVPIWEKKRIDSDLVDEMIGQVIVNNPAIDWNKFLEQWKNFRGPVAIYYSFGWIPLKLTATNIQVMATLETEHGRILKILGKNFPGILSNLDICPSCKAVLRPGFNAYSLIYIYIVFLCGMAAYLFLKVPRQWYPLEIFLVTFGMFGTLFCSLMPKGYQVVDCSDQGLLDLKQEYFDLAKNSRLLLLAYLVSFFVLYWISVLIRR